MRDSAFLLRQILLLWPWDKTVKVAATEANLFRII
jgi:hypothetical protein